MAQVEKLIVRTEPKYNHLERTSAEPKKILEIIPLWGLTFTLFILRNEVITTSDNFDCLGEIGTFDSFHKILMHVYALNEVGDMAVFFNKFNLFALYK